MGPGFLEAMTEDCGAKFVTLWRKQNGKWRMARVINYDHPSSHWHFHAPGNSTARIG